MNLSIIQAIKGEKECPECGLRYTDYDSADFIEENSYTTQPVAFFTRKIEDFDNARILEAGKEILSPEAVIHLEEHLESRK